jgi:hypothetical protein
MRARRELEDDLLHAHGVVERNLARVVEGADTVEIDPPWDGAIRTGGHGRRHGELGIEGREERRREEDGARRQRRGAREAQFGDEPVLEGVPESFDPPLGLRALGDDVVNPERLESSPNLRGILVPLELLGDGPVRIVPHEDAVTVRIHRRGEPDRAP